MDVLEKEYVSFVPQVVPSAPLAGDTDYSDPFDARLNHRPEPDLRPAPCENNGYMEPYEAQRVITGQQTSFVPHQSCSCYNIIWVKMLNVCSFCL